MAKIPEPIIVNSAHDMKSLAEEMFAVASLSPTPTAVYAKNIDELNENIRNADLSFVRPVVWMGKFCSFELTYEHEEKQWHLSFVQSSPDMNSATGVKFIKVPDDYAIAAAEIFFGNEWKEVPGGKMTPEIRHFIKDI